MAKGIYGEGTFSIVKDRPNAPIKYRKRIGGKYVSVQGKTERECLKKMKEKEQKLLEQEKLTHTSDISQCALFKDAVRFWLETYKRGKLKGRSYDRNIQVLHTYIEENKIGRLSIDNVSSNDIQLLLNEVATSKSQSTINKVYGHTNECRVEMLNPASTSGYSFIVKIYGGNNEEITERMNEVFPDFIHTLDNSVSDEQIEEAIKAFKNDPSSIREYKLGDDLTIDY